MVITMAKLRMAHASRLGQKIERLNDGNNNGQLRIATPHRVAHAKPHGPIPSPSSTACLTPPPTIFTNPLADISITTCRHACIKSDHICMASVKMPTSVFVYLVVGGVRLSVGEGLTIFADTVSAGKNLFIDTLTN